MVKKDASETLDLLNNNDDCTNLEQLRFLGSSHQLALFIVLSVDLDHNGEESRG